MVIRSGISISATFDVATQLKDDGELTSSALCQVGGENAILDLGTGRTEHTIVIDISNIKTTDTDEKYEIIPIYSDSATLANDFEAGAAYLLGAPLAIVRDADSTTGRYRLRSSNIISDRAYKYMALYVRIDGTSPSITFSSFLEKE